MSEQENGKSIRGYGSGDVDAVISVEEVTRRAAEMAETISIADLENLVDGESYVAINDLNAGYGKMEILHDFNLRVGQKQSLCLIGPNGRGEVNYSAFHIRIYQYFFRTDQHWY